MTDEELRKFIYSLMEKEEMEPEVAEELFQRIWNELEKYWGNKSDGKLQAVDRKGEAERPGCNIAALRAHEE